MMEMARHGESTQSTEEVRAVHGNRALHPPLMLIETDQDHKKESLVEVGALEQNIGP